MTTEKPPIGRQIRRIRRARLLSQEVLSEQIGIDPKSLGRIEKGDYYPALDTLFRLAHALNVPVSDFFQEPVTDTDTDTVLADIRHAIVDFAYSADEVSLIKIHKQIKQLQKSLPESVI